MPVLFNIMFIYLFFFFFFLVYFYFFFLSSLFQAWLIGLLVLTAIAIVISTFNLIYEAIVAPGEINCTVVSLETGWEL